MEIYIYISLSLSPPVYIYIYIYTHLEKERDADISPLLSAQASPFPPPLPVKFFFSLLRTKLIVQDPSASEGISARCSEAMPGSRKFLISTLRLCPIYFRPWVSWISQSRLAAAFPTASWAPTKGTCRQGHVMGLLCLR